MTALRNRTLFVTGGSRGIGLAIAKRVAADGANVALLAKTAEPHPKLPGTIHTAAAEIEEAGGQALAIVGDARDEQQVADAVAQTAERFGGIDLCLNNASAINLTGLTELPVKRYDLMQQVNARGTFVTTQACLPHLRRSDHAHVLTLSPPLSTDPKWLTPTAPYTLSKMGMTMLTLGFAGEVRDEGIAANCLWPRTPIATAAVQNLLGGDKTMAMSRRPEIMADAAYAILAAPPAQRTGQVLIDDEVLAEAGVTDLTVYDYVDDPDLALDFFLDRWADGSAGPALGQPA